MSEKEQFAAILSGRSAVQEQSMGPIEAAKEGIQAIAPGLSLSKILGDIGHEAKEMFKQGGHELAAALFNESAFVMYPRVGKDLQGQQPEPLEIERDGIER